MSHSIARMYKYKKFLPFSFSDLLIFTMEVGWAWGLFKYIDQYAVFDSEEVKGGYLCKICEMKLSKRWDVLRNHIQKVHKNVPDEDIKKLSNTIPKVAVKCPKCKTPLTGFGHKMKIHLQKYCKGSAEEDESEQDDTMSTEDNMEEDPMFEDNFMLGEEVDNTMKEGKVMKKDMVKVRRVRKRCGGTLWDKVKDPIKKVIKDAQEEEEDVIGDIKDLERIIQEQKQEIVTMKTLLETKDQEMKDLVDILRNKADDIDDDLLKKNEELSSLNDSLNLLIETKDKEIDNLKEVISVHSNTVDKVDSLEKENEKLKRVNESLADEITDLRTKTDELKVVIQNCRKVENLEVEKVKNLKKIGEGGFGKVFKGHYKGRDIAIKVMKLHWTSINEMLIQVKMNSPNIMRSSTYGINWVENNISKSEILVGMELCDSSVHDLIRNTKIDLSKKNEIVIGAASGVQQLHSVPVIHMDIKPENLLLKGNIVKLGDFGLSNFGTTGEGRAGTPGYTAPEVVKALTKYSNKCDMWSLGATLYEIVSGKRLVSKRMLNEKPEMEYELCASLNPEWENIGGEYQPHVRVFKELLVKDPEKRLNADKCLKKVGKIATKKKC